MSHTGIKISNPNTVITKVFDTYSVVPVLMVKDNLAYVCIHDTKQDLDIIFICMLDYLEKVDIDEIKELDTYNIFHGLYK